MPWWGGLVRVLVVGCGRVGAGLAIALAERGDTVSVVDKDPRAFERLGERFLGHAVEGIAFGRETYKVPRVIARIQDPRRATIYEELGITTVATVGWALGKIRDYLEHTPLKEEATFGRGEVALVRLELPQHLVDRSVGDLEDGGGLRVVSITRRGGALVPQATTALAEGDVVRLAIQGDARGRLDALLAEETRR